MTTAISLNSNECQATATSTANVFNSAGNATREFACLLCVVRNSHPIQKYLLHHRSHTFWGAEGALEQLCFAI